MLNVEIFVTLVSFREFEGGLFSENSASISRSTRIVIQFLMSVRRVRALHSEFKKFKNDHFNSVSIGKFIEANWPSLRSLKIVSQKPLGSFVKFWQFILFVQNLVTRFSVVGIGF